nr:hypothetical protein [Tanacetum cinerariifolium]
MEEYVNSTNNVNTICSTVNAAGINEVNAVGENISSELPFDQDIPALEDISTFNYLGDHEDDGEEADMNNLDTTIQDNPTLTTRIYKDHPLDQVIGYLQSATQTRNMTKNLEEHGFTMDFKEEKLIRPYSLKGTKMSSKGELTFFLGLQVKQKNDGKFICQDKYVGEIFKKIRFTKVKNASTPMETQNPLLKDKDREEVDVHMYRSFRYLKGHPKLGLWWPKDSPFDLVAYTDSDYAGAILDRKSTKEGCHYLRSRLISGQCKKQTVVASSKIEAKNVAPSRKAKKSIRLMIEKLFEMELELILLLKVNAGRHNLLLLGQC